MRLRAPACACVRLRAPACACVRLRAPAPPAPLYWGHMFRLEKEMQTPVTRGLHDPATIGALSAILAPALKKPQGLALELKHVRCTLQGCKKLATGRIRALAGPAQPAACHAAVTIDHRMLKQAQALMRAANYTPPTKGISHMPFVFAPLAYKIPDDSIGEKPFDCFVLHGVPAGFLLGFSCPRAGFRAYLVTLDAFVTAVAAGAKRLTPVDGVDVTGLFAWR